VIDSSIVSPASVAERRPSACLSREQVPILVAADRSGTTLSAVLPEVSAETIQAVLEPAIDKDALLVTDGAAAYPRCAADLGISHEALNQSAGERVRGDLHIQTVNNRHQRLKSFLAPFRGIATKYPAQLPALVPLRRSGAPAVITRLSQCRPRPTT
jgi:hypothetical protein